MKNYPLTRREFLRTGVRGAGLLALSGYVPAFLAQTARAVTADKDARILVVIQMSGGNDGLNTIVPFADDAYYKARPGLAIPANRVLKLDEHSGLNPAMKSAADLFAQGKMRIIQNVGYPNPDRSHFRSMEIWHTARQEVGPANGWLGRYFDAQCRGADPHFSQEPLSRATIGVSIGKSMPLAFRNQENVALALDNPETFRWNTSGETAGLARAQQQIFDRLNKPAGAAAMNRMETLGTVAGSEPETVDFLRHTAMNAIVAGDRIRAALAKQQTGYPETDLARQLRMIASLIRDDLPTRVYYANMGGFDTHAQQAQSHGRLLGDLSDSVAAFLDELHRQKLGDKVLVLAFSEFGRRVSENASGGTDHGAAAPMMLFGDSVKAGLDGGVPDLQTLTDGDLKHRIDFRQVYTSILSDWLAVDGGKVMGEKFDKIALLNS